MTQALAQSKVIHRQFEGEVVSAGAQKTVSVIVRTVKIHPKYRKHYTVTRKYPVNDEKRAAKVGNTVRFEECRPISKTKRWRLIAIVK